MNLTQRSPLRAHATALAASLLAAGLAAPLQAAAADNPAATVLGLGTLGGSGSFASGINALGQVVGGSTNADGSLARAFLYSGGVLSDLGSLGGRQNYANAINDTGQVVGQVRTADNAVLHAAAFAGGMVQDINPPFGAFSSSASAINASGQVAGWAQTGGSSFSAFTLGNGAYTAIGSLVAGGNSFAYGINDAGQVVGTADAVAAAGGNYTHAFVYSQGAMQDLGTLNGAQNYSLAFAVNNTGQVVGLSGYGVGNADNHAFIFSAGVMSDLGTVGGANSEATAINARGWTVGDADTAAGATHAVLWKDGRAYDLNAVAPAGWTFDTAAAINARGQIAGTGTHDGHSEAFLLTPKATWLGASGRWDDSAGWSLGVFGALGQTPDALLDVAMLPTGSATVLGSTNASVRSLLVAGQAGSIVSLDLAGGTTSTSAGTSIGAHAVLTGSGQLNGPLSVLAGGVVQVSGGQTMLLTGGPVDIQGVARIVGGGGSANLSATAPVQIAAGGQMQLQGANLDLRGGLLVQGQLNAGAGGNNVWGAVTVASGAKVVLSGNSGTSFYDAVEVQTGAEFRVSAGATATFFGAVTQRTGALFTGSGGKYYEGGLSVGASPGLGTDAGDVTFGTSNVYLAEIGGTSACTLACASDDALKDRSFDKYAVAGRLTLGGTLKLVSWNGFVAQAGQHFDLLDWGTLAGGFDSIDASGLQLAPGTALDSSLLDVDGEITVVAVPEPPVWALLAAGLGALLRRRQTAALHRQP